MSNINTVYSQLKVVVGSLFPNKKLLTHPESLKDNSALFLKDGWGIIVGPSSPFPSQETCRTMDVIEFSIVLTKETFNSNADVSKAFDCNNSMLQDLSDLRVRLLDSDKLGIPNSLAMVQFSSASGIEFVSSDKYNFRSITANFSFLVIEQLG